MPLALTLNGAALPSWLTFTPLATDEVFSDSTQIINANPTFAERGTHVIKATYTPTHGTAISDFTVATIIVECLVTSFANPANPSV